MTSTRGRLQLALIAGAAFLIASLGIAAMFALNQSNKRSLKTATLLYQMEANAHALGSNEWEAIAQARIDSDVDLSSQQFRREILNKLKMIHAFQDREGLVDKVQPAASKY